MIDKLLKIREDFRYAISLEDRTLLGFALNDLDTFLHKNKQALNIDSVDYQREQLADEPLIKFEMKSKILGADSYTHPNIKG